LIKTGFEKFDKCIRGLEKGEMIVIGARPSAGKSAFTTQIICNIAETKKRIGYFNLEMGNEQIYDRTLARYSKIELDRIQNAKYFLNDEEGKFNKANEKLETYDNVMVISKTCSLSDVKSICRQKKFDVVIIDYLQLVKPTRYYENKAAEVGEISKQIKGLAMELKIPIVALSQMNRKVKSTDEPSMSELRESGNIEQDASIIALLWNLNEEGTLKGLKVDKNRQGTTFKETLKFEGALMTFTETDIEVGKAQEYKSVEEAEIPF
jgi:replicative DNA helicase